MSRSGSRCWCGHDVRQHPDAGACAGYVDRMDLYAGQSDECHCQHFLAAPSQTRDLGHDDEIGAAFEAYDRLVRWEEHDSRIDAQDPIHERAAARGRIVALIANLAAAAPLPGTEGNE